MSNFHQSNSPLGEGEVIPPRSIRPWLLRIWRLVALALAAWLLHVAAQNQNPPRSSSISLEQARRFFSAASKVSLPQKENGADEVYDQNGRFLGFIATTSPQADSVIGYVGPNNVLVALSPSGKIIGVDLISSGDTEAHIAEIKKAEGFWKKFIGWSPSHEPAPRIEAVSGSTLTSLGIVEAMQKRLAGRADSLRFPEPLTLEEVQTLFPGAKEFHAEESRPGWHMVKDGANQVVGFAVRTSPSSDYTHGYSGPTESLVAVARDGNRLLGVRLRRSYDTEDYVTTVREDSDYLRQLTGFDVKQWATLDFKKVGLEGVSGATATSFAVADGIRRKFATDAAPPKSTSHFFKARDWALLGIVAGSLVMTFTRLRGRRVVRLAWQAILIGVFGLWCGDLLSLALLAGWAQNGLAWKLAPSLVILVAVALLVPWATRQQIYCYQLCPHGAAQEWLGRFPKLHVRLSPSLAKYLRFGPGILLIVAIGLALILPSFELAALEPFDAWAMRGALLVTTIIALAGLVASLFVPMAYCHYGCPTGALLKFLRTTGSADRFGPRDSVALLFLLAGCAFVFWPSKQISANEPGKIVELHGKAFGTTWSVKLRKAPASKEDLQSKLAAELERIESTLSHWRASSATSRFNAARTTQPIEMPKELVALVTQTLEFSRISDGAFDITVAPLVQAWGFGPNGVPPSAPEPDEIAQLHSMTGWQKLHANINALTLQKNHPELTIDLGGILQGYAVDRLAVILDSEKCESYLLEVGGELFARGRWRVAIENPTRPAEPLRVLFLENAALATSGTYRAQHADKNKRWSHLIDPAIGKPVEHQTTLVSVLHPSCASADAWATTLLVAGGERAESLARTNQLSTLIVTGGRLTTLYFPKDETDSGVEK